MTVMLFSSEVRVTVMLRDSLGFRTLAHTLVNSPDSSTAGMTTTYCLQTQRHSREAHHWFWEVGNRQEHAVKDKKRLNHLTHFKPHTHIHTYGPATTWPTHIQVKRTHSVHVHVWISSRPMTDWAQHQGQHLLNTRRCRKPPPLLVSVTQQYHFYLMPGHKKSIIYRFWSVVWCMHPNTTVCVTLTPKYLSALEEYKNKINILLLVLLIIQISMRPLVEYNGIHYYRHLDAVRGAEVFARLSTKNK